MIHITPNLTSCIRSISLLFIISLITACASGVSNTVKVTEDDMAKFNSMTPEAAIDSLEKLLQIARDEKLPFYTPSYFNEAESLHKNAQQSLAKKKKKEDIIRDIAKADRLLARAKIKKPEVESELKALIAVNDNLVKLKAPSVFKKEYDDISKDLTTLIVKVETNKADKIDKDKSKLLKNFVALEVKIIKHAALHEADEIKTQAKANDALKLAPKTYAKAVNAYQKSEAAIAQNPHDNEKVDAAQKQALFAAKHALSVTKSVAKLNQDYKISPENVIIANEDLIFRISDAINKSDYRDRSITEQISDIVGSINALNNTNKDNIKNTETITELEKQLKEKNDTLSDANEELEKVKADLSDRNKQMIKMAADSIHSQNVEKELKSQIALLKTKPKPIKSTPKKNSDPEKPIATEKPTSKTESTQKQPVTEAKTQTATSKTE